jgi:phage terminase large subunit-like protein
LAHQRRILRHVFKRGKDGRFPYNTIIYSAPKKSGKTEIGGAATLWYALFSGENPNELYSIANDLEQARSRAFTRIVSVCEQNPRIAAKVSQFNVKLPTGTVLKAISNDFAGAAGGNQGFTLWDELWGYVSEASRRLYDEMTPVPTRLNSIRFITTYAGFLGQSQLLWELYLKGVGKEEHPEGQGEQIAELADLPCYHNGKLFVYWDHEARMPWQSKEYYDDQRKSLRTTAYDRLHQNVWVSGEGQFIPIEWWDAVILGEQPQSDVSRQVVIGVDAATKRDAAAIVGVGWSTQYDAPELLFHRVWIPRKGETLDLEKTVEAFLEQASHEWSVVLVNYDPFQLARSAAILTAKGLPMKEFPQTTANLTDMSGALYTALKERRFVAYKAEDIRYAFTRTSAVDTLRGVRIARKSHQQRIDVIVAMAMATLGASRELSSSGNNRFSPDDVVIGRRYEYAEQSGSVLPTVIGARELTGEW